MNQITRTASRTGMMIALAGTAITAAHAQSTSAHETTADARVAVGSNESGDRGAGTLPEIIAGPFQRNNKAYYLLEPATWELSEQAANQRLGAHLVAISDSSENSFIRNFVLNFDGSDRNGWIGLTDRDSEGTFVWTNDEPVVYTPWNPGEPNGGTTQNYAGMVQGFSVWYDLEDNWGDLFASPMFGVVEVDVPVIEAGPFYYNGHTYYLLDESDRHQADTAARLLGGHLVTFEDADETNWVISNVIQFDGVPRHTWLGLTDENYEGIYRWDNGSLASYRSWIPNEPNGGTIENYVAMFLGSSLWFDAAYNWSPDGAVVHGVVEIGSPNPCFADVNNDGQLNFFDISEYINAFNTGCQ